MGVSRMVRRRARIAAALTLASGLGGCLAGAAEDAPTAATPVVTTPKAAPFTPVYGSFQSEGVVTRVTTLSTKTATGTSVTASDIALLDRLRGFTTSATRNTTTTGRADQQDVVVASSGLGASGTQVGRIEGDNAGLYRGSASNAAGDSIYFTTTPATNMEASLGVTSLAYSYIGLGSFGTTGATATTSSYDGYLFGLFGGQKTPLMPTTGSATYKGAFEGTEVAVTTGAAAAQKADVYGAMQANVNFGSGKVTGRIDDIQAYRASATSTTPSKASAAYSLTFTGDVFGSGFVGKAVMTHAGTDTPYAGVTQNGAVQGGFFGPQAAETAGALAVTTAAGNTKTVVTGAFGAKKQ